MATFSSHADDIFDYPVLDFTGDFIAGSGISADDKKSLIPVGTVSIWTQNEIPEFWLECDGRTVDPVRYPELRKLMSKLPDYRGRFLQGTDTGKNVGDRLEAGLPNITGNFRGAIEGGSGPTAQGAMYTMWTSSGGPCCDGGWKLSNIFFNASRSSSIYGKSTTVQPPSVIVKYIIKAE